VTKINIEIRPEEKEQVIKALKQLGSKDVVTIKQIAVATGQNPNRTRFVVQELLEEGRIVRHIAVQYNARYTRYRYEVL